MCAEASSPVAGVVYPVLEVTVGAGQRLSSSSANLIVRDDYKGYFSGTEVDASIDDLSPAGGWQVWDAANEEWDSDSGPVGSDNKEGTEPLRYRALFAPWNTMTQPLGNNGDHSLFIGEQVDNEWAVMHLQFEEWVVGTGWSNAYELGPTPIATEARNLYISNCTSSNGTIDYFKYDPDGDQSLAQPHIAFTIVDPDPHNYCCIIRFRQTVGEGTWNWDSGWYSMRAVLSGTTADINLTAEDYQGNCLEPEDGWGTYTYEVLVLEYEGGTPVWTQGEALDWQFLKRYRDGYHLWVPKNLPAPYGEEPGHDVWTEVPEEGEAQLRGYYALEGDWGAGESQVPRGNDAQIVVVDPELAERSQTTGPGGVATLGAAYGTVDADEDEALDGLALYTYQEADPAGTWRGIFMASDNGGLRSPAWRTHEPVRMITANEVVVEKRAYAIVGRSITDRSARRDALADGIEDAGYVEVLINTEIDDASDAAIAATMRRSHYFHFYGHGASVAGDGAYKCVHWIQIAGSEDPPRNLGVPCSAPWAATLGDWCGRMRHTHMQGCSTAVPCIGAPCFGSVYLPSIADYALEQGAQSSAGARHCLSDSEAVLWMDAFYGYADERDENGKFIRDIWGAIQDATDWMDAEHPGSSYGRVEREGVMVPAIKYIGPRDILIAPR